MTTLYNNGASVGATQLAAHYYERKALIEAQQEAYFSQLADVKNMPHNSGKEIKQYRYMPVIDDRNTNGWGLDATGARYANGNLYGSSTDVGTIADKYPLLGEQGGRVNKIDFTRIELRSNLVKGGLFFEYTADLIRHDSDDQILDKMNRELMVASHKIYEDRLQGDLLTNASLVKYTGTATQQTELAHGMDLTYMDLVRLGIDLDKAHCPKQTKIVTGTRNIDTKTIPDCRVAFCGSELIPTFEAMKDLHDKPAFIPTHQYAAGTTLLKGEVGRIAGFRIVVVPEMQKWAGKGATATDASYHKTNGNYDVFPFLVVGDESFTTIGFLENGKGGQKFHNIHKKPSVETADRNDPYGEMGFSSTKWWYGFMPQFIERLALIKCVAKM